MKRLPPLCRFLDEFAPVDKGELLLFRGQDCDKPLYPKIARENPNKDSTPLERKMLVELRRLGSLHLPRTNEGDWDLMTRAQHYGLATRLLDWTANPLVGVWFAVRDQNAGQPGYVFTYHVQPASLRNDEQMSEPFKLQRPVVFRPNRNNPRIIAQSGWFSAHPYSTDKGRYAELGQKRTPLGIDVWEIPGAKKHSLIADLSQLGVNYQAMFPDLEGVCRHVNWLHDFG